MSGSGEEMVNVLQAAEMLGIGRTKVFQLVREGRLQPINRTPLLKRPRMLMFHKSDVLKLARGE